MELTRESQAQRLKDGTSSVLKHYEELIGAAKLQGGVEQQLCELSTAVHAAGLLQSLDSMLQLVRELRNGALQGEYQAIAQEVRAVAASHDEQSKHGNHTLHAMDGEMRNALKELEVAYYSRRYTCDTALSEEGGGGSKDAVMDA